MNKNEYIFLQFGTNCLTFSGLRMNLLLVFEGQVFSNKIFKGISFWNIIWRNSKCTHILSQGSPRIHIYQLLPIKKLHLTSRWFFLSLKLWLVARKKFESNLRQTFSQFESSNSVKNVEVRKVISTKCKFLHTFSWLLARKVPRFLIKTDD